MTIMSDMAETARTTIARTLKMFEREGAIARAYSDVYATDPGRMVIEDIMRKAGILTVASDPTDSRFYDGRRAVALEVLRMLRFTESEMIALARATAREDMERLVE
jgi:hypothetical protein